MRSKVFEVFKTFSQRRGLPSCRLSTSVIDVKQTLPKHGRISIKKVREESLNISYVLAHGAHHRQIRGKQTDTRSSSKVEVIKGLCR